MRYRIHDYLLEISRRHDEDIQIYIGFSLEIRRISLHIRYSARIVVFDYDIRLCLLSCEVHTLNSHGDIRSACHMVCYHGTEVYIAYHIAIGESNIIGIYIRYAVVYALERFKARIVERIYIVGISRDIRRKNFHAAASACQIPVLAASDMVHERLVIIMGDDADIVYIGIYHIRKGKIHETVSASERNRCKSTVSRKLRNIAVMYI